ncbi:MAG: DUF5119 domain-containing protein [Bacteroidales bacterium]|nr:DUF5119 domain-containing protein [Bacteroidales bacterium]
MKTLKTLIITVFCMAVCGLFAGCEHHDLCYHHVHIVKIRLAFDWQDAPDANPEGMTVYFYPEDECRSGESEGNNTIRMDFRGKEGGEIDIPIGRYRIIAYNNDSEVCFGNMTDYYSQHHIRTRDAEITEMMGGMSVRATRVARPDGTEDERVALAPDQMWGCNATEVEITEYGVKYKCFPMEEKDEWVGLEPIVTEHVITLYPHDLICHYSYEIRNVEGLSLLTDACAAITGMSPTFSISRMMQSDDVATIPLAARKSGDDKIVGEFLTFGHPADNAGKHRFALYAWIATKQTSSSGTRAVEPRFFGKDEENFDVTLQCDTAPDQRNVHLIIDGLDLTEGGTLVPPGSFDPNFGDWGEKNFDLIVK